MHHRKNSRNAQFSGKKQTLAMLLCSASLTCATVNAGSWSDEQSIAGMDVWVYTPDTVSAIGNGRAALVVLHGCGQTGDDYRHGANLEITAESYGMVIATPTVPNGGIGPYGCWDYYDTNHSRDSRHHPNLIELGQWLQSRDDIDSNQVYLAGLSSGATQAQVTGCLAPDVFAGVGATGGPVMGTTATQAFLTMGSASTAAALCESWAGSHLELLIRQSRNIAHGSEDSLAPYSEAETNMEAIGLFKSTSKNDGTTELLGASEESWGSHGDATKLTYIAMGHRWAAGGGEGGNFIDNSATRINYASYLANFFAKTNQRVKTDTSVGAHE